MIKEAFSHIHPIMVHFPIALIIIATCYDLFIVFAKRKLSPRQGFWLWLVAFIFAWIAVMTGPDEDARGNTNIFHLHENLAHYTTILAFLIVALRFFFLVKKKEFIRLTLIIYCILIVICTVGILSTGYFGGKMVYDQGVGVKMHGKYVNPPKPGKYHMGD